MKKLFTSLFLLLAVSVNAFSQTKGTTEFGICVGYNGSTVTTSNLSADYRSGVNAGVSIEHYFSESWSFKSKVLYDQKGWANGYYIVNSNNSSSNYTTTNYNLNYLSIPILANWHFGRTKNWYLNFGPYIGFLLSANLSTNNVDVKNSFNTVDGGLDLGIGVKFPVSKNTKFFIEFNGEGGVANIASGNSGTTIRNSVSAFNVGLNFK